MPVSHALQVWGIVSFIVVIGLSTTFRLINEKHLHTFFFIPTHRIGDSSFYEGSKHLYIKIIKTVNMSTDGKSLVTYYKPSEIISIFRNLLSAQNLNAKIVSLNGVYIKNQSNQLYNNCAYDTLRDENTEEEISLLMPRNLRDELKSGNVVTVFGTVDRKMTNKGFIQIILKVTRLNVIKEQALSEKEMKQIEFRNLKSQKGFKNVDSLLEDKLFRDQKPIVALLYADSSITNADFKKGVEAASTHITFKESRVSFSNAKDLSCKLKELDALNYDVIAIVRGGGSGIEKLDEIEVVEALTNLKTAWIYGVGHEKENLFIRNIADKVIPIPFALGTYFRDTVNSVIEKKSKSKAVLVEEIKRQFIKQIEDANKQNKALQERLTALTKSSEISQKQSKEQLEAMKKQQEEAYKQAKQQTEAMQRQNHDLQEKLKGMQKSLDEFTKTNSQMIKENTNLNNTIRKLTTDLTAAQNHSKELERQLRERNKGCFSGCLGMFIVLIGFTCCIVTFIVRF